MLDILSLSIGGGLGLVMGVLLFYLYNKFFKAAPATTGN